MHETTDRTYEEDSEGQRTPEDECSCGHRGWSNHIDLERLSRRLTDRVFTYYE